MPEGDTIFRAARTLHRAFAGHAIVRFESTFPALNRVASDRPIVGRSIESVRSRGQHLLMTCTGDLILHTHMRTNGSWHIYRPGERWQRSHDAMRILIGIETLVAVGFNVPVANVLEPAHTLGVGFGRRTTRSMNPAAKLWVYSRGGKPCRRCGAVIQAKKTGLDARITYWCPACQPGTAPASL